MPGRTRRMRHNAHVADEATQRLRIDASLDEVWSVLTDFERYPSWAADIKEARVIERDGEGRASAVAFRAAAMGRSVQYRLDYDYSDAPKRLAWRLAEGDIMRVLDGSYEFAEAGDGGGVDVTYNLRVDLVVPLPAFVKRRAESKIISTALRSLRRHVEGP